MLKRPKFCIPCFDYLLCSLEHEHRFFKHRRTFGHTHALTHVCIYIFFCTLKLLIDSTYIELTGIKNVNLYTYKELRVATNDFSPSSKIGEGGFGSVYKVFAYCIQCHPYSLRNTDHHHFIMLKMWF